MGTFCFDQYGHPSLWCEEKKRLIERRDAEESVNMWKRKKAEELANIERDKREYHDMSVTHCPWGRPGGGAPNLDIRMRNILAEGLQPTPSYSIRGSALPPCRLNVNPGGGGGGAEIRSAADRLYITLKEHPAMTFRNKGHVDIELRYKGREPKVKLDKIVVKEKPSGKEKKKSRSREPRMASKDRDPWGKPGPGGVPWRNPKTVGNSFMRSMGWTNKELLEELDRETQTTPPKQNNYRQQQSMAPSNGRSTMTKTTAQAQQCCALCSCKCVSTMASSSSELQKVAPAPPKELKKQSSKESYKYNGVTMCNKATSTTHNTQPFKIKKICPMKREQRIPRLCNQQGLHPSYGGIGHIGSHAPARESGGGVELVPLLARRRGMHRPTSLSSTDVTKPPDPPNRWSRYDSQYEYLNDLKRQSRQRRHREKQFQEEEMDLCRKHYVALDSFWGRPGHGAPRENIGNTKFNLDDLLYGVPVE